MGIKRTAFDVIVSKRNFNRLQSRTHTICEVLRSEGFRVRGEVFEADWPITADGRMVDIDAEGTLPVGTIRVYKAGESPEVYISDRAGWVAVDRIGFVSGGPRGPLLFPQAVPDAHKAASKTVWRAKGWNKSGRSSSDESSWEDLAGALADLVDDTTGAYSV